MPDRCHHLQRKLECLLRNLYFPLARRRRCIYPCPRLVLLNSTHIGRCLLFSTRNDAGPFFQRIIHRQLRIVFLAESPWARCFTLRGVETRRWQQPMGPCAYTSLGHNSDAGGDGVSSDAARYRRIAAFLARSTGRTSSAIGLATITPAPFIRSVTVVRCTGGGDAELGCCGGCAGRRAGTMLQAEGLYLVAKHERE